MIDLHTHSIFSDGELIPSELVRRAEVIGYHAIAITDHADISNLDFIVPRIVSVCDDLSSKWRIRAIPGIEITHVPPSIISQLEKRARSMGANIVVVHGETTVEPVPPGTNREALLSNIDILAHPGLITEEEAEIAKERGIYLEITTRAGHSLTNGHVAKLATRIGAKLVLNTDSHSPHDLITLEKAKIVAMGAGLSEEEFNKLRKNSMEILEKMKV
ncbi:MAG: PHP domain-containing protein [Deltaproteobacteria bacterium CG12_big_fil_rev_8_21_14_0_65_43_10]|nr:MAG: PHP domain-containing protein [Deltaproteobacteria bacterium CG2_30_43_15]PIQ44643.1 MAG: PHP domain-containing protein [Deltaproteobacteria bacterium CG12_big_fil_rev_8_21_14_0_65_43_10]PIZ20178.1 MAG: PHP domain-containing protein [Deltaproteobacteria bacterium CG_4_10_14_0_8_um_filter_43_12]HCX90060.1 PHP domain-containing protein [Deltaproteobacteria bacterium]